MAFPVNPTNGQTAVINYVTYVYNSALGVWTNQGAVASASPVTSVAGRTGSVTLTPADIVGTGTFANALTFSSAITASSTLSVSGATTLNSVVSTGGANVSSLIVTGTSTMTGTVAINNTLTVSSQINPGASNTYDLGTTTARWRNIYTNDLQLSNGIGDYTIVEGEEDLFLYNNKTKKVFKFLIQEVDPSEAPPKAKTN